MKDHVSIRITFSDKGAEVAKQIAEFIEENYQNISFQKPTKGNNPKYQEGGRGYNPEQGEFSL